MSDLRNMPPTIVTVYYGPPGHRRPEGQAEIIQAKHLDGTLYRATVHFLGDPPDCIQEREIDISQSKSLFPA